MDGELVTKQGERERAENTAKQGNWRNEGNAWIYIFRVCLLGKIDTVVWVFSPPPLQWGIPLSSITMFVQYDTIRYLAWVDFFNLYGAGGYDNVIYRYTISTSEITVKSSQPTIPNPKTVTELYYHYRKINKFLNSERESEKKMWKKFLPLGNLICYDIH